MEGNQTNIKSSKAEIFKELLELMIQGLEKGQIDTPDSKKASEFILDVIGKANDEVELRVYCEELCERWECFKPILLHFEHEEAKAQDAEKIENAQEELDKLKGAQN